jgi:hypothetical protein
MAIDVVGTIAWGVISIMFLILFFHSRNLYNNFEKKRKKGELKSTLLWENNIDDIVKTFADCFKGLAVASMLACVVSIIAALLPIFI